MNTPRVAEVAERIRTAKDVPPLKLAGWNAEACIAHRPWINPETDEEVWDRPKPGCRQCGILLRKHQRIAVAWLYAVRRGLIADSVGTGKTACAAGLVSFLRAREDPAAHHTLVVMRPPAIPQFANEWRRVMPMLWTTQLNDRSRDERTEKLIHPWSVAFIGWQMLQREYERLAHFLEGGTLIIDDVDPLRHDTRTAYAIKQLASIVSRMAVFSGTPLQKKLEELYRVLQPLGGSAVLGTPKQFDSRYIRRGLVTVDQGNGRKQVRLERTGYQNLSEFREKIQPFVLRRTAKDIDDVTMPVIIPNPVFLDMTAPQRAKYDELKRGAVRIMKQDGTRVRRMVAESHLHLGAQICDGLATLGEHDAPDASCKLNWIEEKLDGDLSDEKVVIFSYYKSTINNGLIPRLTRMGIGHVVLTGDQPDMNVRQALIDRFWNDPACRVLIGTTAIEQSLNLQVSRHLINIDTIRNPQRELQKAGRIARSDSVHPHVYVHNLFCSDTLEERYLPMLEREQALVDHVWGETSELYNRLSPLEMMQLITG
jgi:superfamily II DNA or RNA helicase